LIGRTDAQSANLIRGDIDKVDPDCRRRML
jgi:hypothetical protein